MLDRKVRLSESVLKQHVARGHSHSIVTVDPVCLDARKRNISCSAALITLCPIFLDLMRSYRFYFSQCHDEVVEFLSHYYYLKLKPLSYGFNWLVAPAPPRKTRGELYKDVDADYYGYRDEDDGVLVPLEQEAENEGKLHAKLFWKVKVEPFHSQQPV